MMPTYDINDLKKYVLALQGMILYFSISLPNYWGGGGYFSNHWDNFIEELIEIHSLQQYTSAFTKGAILKRIPNIAYTSILARLNTMKLPDDTEPGNFRSNYVTK